MDDALSQLPADFAPEVERLPAVDWERAASDPSFSSSRGRGFSPVDYPRVEGDWGVAACMFSHLAALAALASRSAALAASRLVWLVLEDDAVVPADLRRRWEQIWPYVPEDWDILRLGWFGASECKSRINEHLDLASWADPPPRGPCRYCGSHAYVVNPASAEKVLWRLNQSRIAHVDCLLGARTPPGEDPVHIPALRSFAVRPKFEQMEGFLSDRV